MLIDKDIQLSSTLTKFQGKDINDPAPTAFSFVVAGGVVETDIYGVDGAGALVQIKKPLNVVPQPVMKFNLVRSIFPFGSFANAQAEEGDLRVTIGGVTYPFDNQVSCGLYMVGDLSGNWHPTLVKVPAPPPYQWTQYRIACLLDQTKQLASQTSLSINGAVPLPIPASFVQSAENIGWGDLEIIGQAQCCLKTAGQMGYAWKWDIEWE